MRKALVGIVFAACLWLFVQGLGLHITFLRAESGLYLEGAAMPWAEMKGFIRHYVLRSYSGHYTPIAFLLELLQSRVFQTHEILWMARQMLVLGILAGVIASFVARISGNMRLGIAVAVIVVIQPTFIELATWPFMALQIACLALTVAAAERLVNFIEHNENRDLAWFLGLAYATMHVFGVGIAVSCAAIGTGALFVAQPARRTRSRLLMLALALAATAVHGYMMSASAEPGLRPAVTLRIALLRFGALSVESLYAALRAAWGNDGFPWPRTDMLTTQGAYGLALVVTALAGLWRVRRRPVALALSTFAFAGFCGYVILVVYRLNGSGADAALLPFLIGGRYVVFPALFLLLGAAAYLSGGSWPVATVTAAGAVVASAIFFATATSSVWPHLLVSHEERWEAVVARARSELSERGVVGNESLQALDPEFASDLKLRRRLLEHALGCTACVRFEGEETLPAR